MSSFPVPCCIAAAFSLPTQLKSRESRSESTPEPRHGVGRQHHSAAYNKCQLLNNVAEIMHTSSLNRSRLVRYFGLKVLANSSWLASVGVECSALRADSPDWMTFGTSLNFASVASSAVWNFLKFSSSNNRGGFENECCKDQKTGYSVLMSSVEGFFSLPLSESASFASSIFSSSCLLSQYEDRQQRQEQPLNMGECQNKHKRVKQYVSLTVTW